MVHGDDISPALIADLGVRGVWTPQAEALFDVRVTDTDASSYVNRSVTAFLASAEERKIASICLLLSHGVPLLLHLLFQLMGYFGIRH